MTTSGLTSAAGNFGSPLQLLIILAVVLLLFGGKRLRNLGGDLGNAIKGFKSAVAPTEAEKKQSDEKRPSQLNHDQTQLISTNENEKSSANRAN